MKYLIITILLSLNSSCQSNQKKTIQDKIFEDSTYYKQFLDLGKCSCMDILIKKTSIYAIQSSGKDNSLFSRHFYTLYDMNYPIPVFYKIENIKNTFINYQNENIDEVLSKYKEKDELIKLNYHSPFLFCDKLFEENTKTKSLYKSFIYNKDNYIKNKSNEEKYLKSTK